MKHCLVQSETDQEDKEAAILIQKEMVDGESKIIMWHSNLGRKIAVIDDIIQDVQGHSKRLQAVERDTCNLKYQINCLDKNIKEVERKATKEKLEAKKEKPKEPDEKPV